MTVGSACVAYRIAGINRSLRVYQLVLPNLHATVCVEYSFSLKSRALCGFRAVSYLSDIPRDSLKPRDHPQYVALMINVKDNLKIYRQYP